MLHVPETWSPSAPAHPQSQLHLLCLSLGWLPVMLWSFCHAAARGSEAAEAEIENKLSETWKCDVTVPTPHPQPPPTPGPPAPPETELAALTWVGEHCTCWLTLAIAIAAVQEGGLACWRNQFSQHELNRRLWRCTAHAAYT